MQVTGLCRHHSFEAAHGVCRQCGMEFCESCIVFPMGKKTPICKECAVRLGGVRSGAGRAPMNPRHLKKRVKAFDELMKARQERGQVATMVATETTLFQDQRPSTTAAETPASEPADSDRVDWSNPFA